MDLGGPGHAGLAGVDVEPPTVGRTTLSGFGFVRRPWTADDARPWVLETIDLFGADRACVASDFPTDKLFGTLDHTLGNRTHAANILGISIRTLRNKLNQYADEGTNVPEPGERRSVA